MMNQKKISSVSIRIFSPIVPSSGKFPLAGVYQAVLGVVIFLKSGDVMEYMCRVVVCQEYLKG